MSTHTHAARAATFALFLGGLMTMGFLGVNTVVSLAAAGAQTPIGNTLSVSVSTRVAFEPADVVVRVALDPDADNRALHIEWTSETGISGSHLVPLDGDRASGHYEFALKGLVSGDYTVAAVLMRSNRTEVRRDTRVVILRGSNL